MFETLIDANLAQPFVLVHRDYHSPNLMLTDLPAGGPDYGPNPGVIDFQDAVVGPITYDLASVLTDARTTWEEPQQLDWGIRYWEMARKAGLPVAADFADFHRAYEWMGCSATCASWASSRAWPIATASSPTWTTCRA